ncbi:MAG: nicotinate-nucleotide--dimethylbenzimidazole phosphoribosyltransferase, partial [Pseudomonadota bacterium]|nr:nicotinate-nucleotide--dimethylbenzimidazole phosphoribosyltransferase [Pseudomonadota bacterium]
MTMKSIDTQCQQFAQQRQNSLTKPPGSLGNLEAIAIQLAGCQGQVCPEIKAPWITVFAAD